MVKYTYDLWGKIISVKNASGQEITDQNNIAHINPYKYRGYRYDKEIGLYYLQSRYYNPEWGRFVNADTVINSYGNLENSNMYSYCNNNPVNMCDSEGDFAWLLILGAVAVILLSIPDIIDMAQEATWGNAAILATNFIPGGKAANVGAKVVKTAAKSSTRQAVKNVAKSASKEVIETTKKVHGNSLNTTVPAEGYVLLDRTTGVVKKFGETTRGVKRYTNKFLEEKNVKMVFLVKGTKREMHYWQHDRIVEYKEAHNQKRPKLNKSDW